MDEIKHILVPVDFSENSQKILRSAAGFAAKFGAKMSVVFVVQSFDDYSGFFVPHMSIMEFEEDMTRSASTKMQGFVAETLSGAEPCNPVILSGDVVEELNNFAAKQGVDLIIMGTHGYKGLEKILFGSVAEQVVKTAPCPVLTINPYR